VSSRNLYIIDQTVAGSFRIPDEECLVYSLNGNVALARGQCLVNRPSRLHQVADDIRDQYVALIASLNDEFLRYGLVSRGLSLFHISDCSCKRTEFFGTYEIICNLLCLKELLEEYKPKCVFLVGGTASFLEGLKSISAGVKIVSNNAANKEALMARALASDLCFIAKILVVSIWSSMTNRLNERVEMERDCPSKLFFSIFPKMSDPEGNDRKYGALVQDTDGLAVTILSDGLHQNVSVREFFRLRKLAKTKGFLIIDDYFSVYHCFEMLGWVFRLHGKLLFRGKRHCFLGVDITSALSYEIAFSRRRMARLIGFRGALERFFEANKCLQFNYYLHEYPIGRVISFVLERVRHKIHSVGWQHGPAAWRKLVSFMDPKEVASEAGVGERISIPMEVFAEDEESVKMYQHAGFVNVRRMERIYRLDYLDSVAPKKEDSIALVVPGLHDGPQLLAAITDWHVVNKHDQVFFKPHPSASERYLKERSGLQDIKITREPIDKLLGHVGIVFVTYSSVGIEAAMLGIETVVVDIPGKINESPLLDGDWLASFESPIARRIPQKDVAPTVKDN
jgi:hypothetical protein